MGKKMAIGRGETAGTVLGGRPSSQEPRPQERPASSKHSDSGKALFISLDRSDGGAAAKKEETFYPAGIMVCAA
ncbi:MAG: hypothetical protein VR64_06920 [Desulfatitalea sp. BRH_c12]|nr:MAG: hypothetical protein VR64_06920 [Desulfatitalea sp. BRH_c12]